MAFEKELEKLFGEGFLSPYFLYVYESCVYVEGVKKLYVATENEISFSTKKCDITLFGNLNVKDVGNGYLAIEGEVEKIEIKRNEKSKNNRQNERLNKTNK